MSERVIRGGAVSGVYFAGAVDETAVFGQTHDHALAVGAGFVHGFVCQRLFGGLTAVAFPSTQLQTRFFDNRYLSGSFTTYLGKNVH